MDKITKEICETLQETFQKVFMQQTEIEERVKNRFQKNGNDKSK